MQSLQSANDCLGDCPQSVRARQVRPSKLPSSGRKCDADADEDCEKAKDFIVIPILPLYNPYMGITPI